MYSTYVVVAPQIVRAGSTYDVIVTIFTGTNVNVNVRLHDSRDVNIATNSMTINAGLSSIVCLPAIFDTKVISLAAVTVYVDCRQTMS